MAKKIALFIDGTGQSSVHLKPDSTNVFRLFSAVPAQSGVAKLYLPGVGTFGGKVRRGAASMTGYGVADKIKEAYRFLSMHYQQGDLIYLFGFSRGALIARSLAGFADSVGLLLKDHCDSGEVEQAYLYYEQGTDPKLTDLHGFLREIRTSGQIPPEGDDRLPIYFIGIWDTAEALGAPFQRLSMPFTRYHQTQLPKNVTIARHALAIHERRKDFEPLLWHGKHPHGQDQSLQQVWFPGSHSDVGGGYVSDANLANAALQWMADEATEAKLPIGKLAFSNAGKVPVIHQEIHVVDWRGIKLRYPTRTRKRLRPRHLDDATLNSMYFHTSAIEQWRNPAKIPYRRAIRTALSKVDTIALNLLLLLSRNAHRVIGQTKVEVEEPTSTLANFRRETWWRCRDLTDLTTADQILSDMVGSATNINGDFLHDSNLKALYIDISLNIFSKIFYTRRLNSEFSSTLIPSTMSKNPDHLIEITNRWSNVCKDLKKCTQYRSKNFRDEYKKFTHGLIFHLSEHPSIDPFKRKNSHHDAESIISVFKNVK